jgi:hypothetical protein
MTAADYAEDRVDGRYRSACNLPVLLKILGAGLDKINDGVAEIIINYK